MEIKERPILFNEEMVRAILDGRKTQTRRIVKNVDPKNFPYCGTFDEVNGLPAMTFADDTGDSVTSRIFASCKFGKPGDRLWVRETWSKSKQPYLSGQIFYRADGEANGKQFALSYVERESKWRPSIHMPRYKSRILLEVINVRVERLHDISEVDAIAEGWPKSLGDFDAPAPGNGGPFDWYRSLWETINGQGSWDLNPWVWVIEFKVIENGQT